MTRDTPQRRAIRRAVESAGRPLSPQEILTAARREHGSLGLATVYRTVKSGVEAGWLQPVELPGEPLHYELAGKRHHHHFSCRGCGRVFDVPGCPGDLDRLAPPGFELESHDLVLYGRCVRCRR
ncbi:MAG: Fur family transcriptional regulator [Phycisphaeraceae bacterium]